MSGNKPLIWLLVGILEFFLGCILLVFGYFSGWNADVSGLESNIQSPILIYSSFFIIVLGVYTVISSIRKANKIERDK